MIVAGVAVDALGAFAERVWHQPEPELVGLFSYRAKPAKMVTRYSTIEVDALKSAPEVRVNWRHGDRILGEVKALERAGDGGLWAIGEVDADKLPHSAGPLFWSIEAEQRPGEEHWTLTGMAVTPSPGGCCLRPLRIFDGGDNGDLIASGTLAAITRDDAWTGGMLTRAAQTVKDRRYQFPTPPLTITGGKPPELTKLAPGMYLDEDGELVAGSTRTGGLMAYDDNGQALGRLHIRPSRIISVEGRPVRPR